MTLFVKHSLGRGAKGQTLLRHASCRCRYRTAGLRGHGSLHKMREESSLIWAKYRYLCMRYFCCSGP